MCLVHVSLMAFSVLEGLIHLSIPADHRSQKGLIRTDGLDAMTPANV